MRGNEYALLFTADAYPQGILMAQLAVSEKKRRLGVCIYSPSR